MSTPEIEAFITHLAVDRNVAVSTQNQALSAVLFLYRYVLNRELEMPPSLVRPGRPKRLPTVLTHAEAGRVIACMNGVPRIMTSRIGRSLSGMARVKTIVRRSCRKASSRSSGFTWTA
jgi:site-specific recombinase XerD